MGIECELIAGGKGVFDVVADGVTLFSKHKSGRFPNAKEIIEQIA
jgi:selT/selW/selH-like putative selenoprotein